MLRHIPAYSGTRRTYQTFSLNMWGDGRDRYRRITRYCLTISIYLFVSVVYTSAVKARYNYRFEITSPNSARYFTRWFESRRLHICREIQIRYYIRLRTNNPEGVFQLASRLAIEQNEFVSRWCSLGKLCLGVSKDTGSSDSLRKVLVQRVREMDVAVNWLNRELVVGKGWQLPLRESC